MDKPAIIIELQWNCSASGAISQIKEKVYPRVLQGFSGKIILVGINYDKKIKEHQCRIDELIL